METSSPIVPAGRVIVIAAEVVLTKTPCPADAVKFHVLTACQEVPPPIYVLSLAAVVFLLVPPAPSSIINKSASTMSAPISVAPSISKPAILSPPAAVASVPAKVAFAPLKVNAVVVPDLIIKLPLVFVRLPNVVPPSLTKISPPSASRTISVPASIFASAEEEIVKSVPSPSIFHHHLQILIQHYLVNLHQPLLLMQYLLLK